MFNKNHIEGRNGKHSNTAVLVFSRTEQDEFLVKAPTFNTSQDQFSSLYQGLLTSTLNQVNLLSLPVFIFDSNQQQGKSFGQRITHAIKHVFANGYSNIIVVGNDCPEMDINEVSQKIGDLESGKSILGPDRRGGVYLLGINKALFDSETFEKLPWQSEYLYNALCQLFSEKIELSQRRDINTRRDIYAVRYSVQPFLSQIIDEFLLVKTVIKNHSATANQNFALGRVVQTIEDRGPPALHVCMGV